MRIAHIAHNFSNLSETFIYDLINTQRKLEHTGHVFTFNRRNEQRRPYPSEYIHIIRQSNWNIWRYWNFFKANITGQNKETANWNLYRKQLKKKLQDINPDIIHAHFGNMGVLIEPIANELNISLIVTFHGYDISVLPKKSYWKENYQRLFTTASAVVGVSNHVCQRLKQHGADVNKIHMVHNGIDTDKFHPNSHKKAKNEKLTFTFIGRFVEKKAPLILLKSYMYFLQSYGIKNVELQMVGNGPLLNKSKKFVKENNIERFVSFLGFVDHSEIPSILRSTDVYVQHSIKAESGDEEGMGLTLAEALASETPVIVTRHNGFPDVVLHNKTGFLVEEGNFEEMGNKMYQLYQDPQLRMQMGKEGQKHIADKFEKSQQTEKILDLYRRVLNS